MNQRLTVQELAIAIATQQHNPTLLNPDFLKYSGVVPADWQLARPPVLTNTTAQVIYQNGISIIAQANRIIFSASIADKNPAEVEIDAIARRYVEALPQVNYQGIGINLRGHVPFTQHSQAAHDYIFGTLLASGLWQTYGTGTPQAALRFTYGLEQARLDLEVTEAGLKMAEQEAIPAILFTATFSHALSQDHQLADLGQAISQWQSDLQVFQDIVNARFLQSDLHPLNSPVEPVMTVA